LIDGGEGRKLPKAQLMVAKNYRYKSMGWGIPVGFMRRFGSVITYL
jgi:hypothetical protein